MWKLTTTTIYTQSFRAYNNNNNNNFYYYGHFLYIKSGYDENEVHIGQARVITQPKKQKPGAFFLDYDT
jgi:hypothetical protein